mmetsp:Transcript_21105/g.25679  ORF Transcript_21105/g.25679 Transcript_21105/m.25679 type:complete len:683 (+) Transcript_21105:164-2212(+)
MKGHSSRRTGQRSLSLFAVAKAFALGIVFGIIFLLISPEPDYHEAAVQSSQGGKPKLTVSSKMQALFSLTSEPTWGPTKSPTKFPTRYPTNFPTTPAPTVYGCKSKLETPSWVSNLNLDAQINYDGDLKYYMDPEFDSRPLIACFFELLQVPKTREWCSEESDWECAVKLSDIQHLSSFASEFDHVLADIAIMEGFRNHKNRVHDPKEAHLVVVDFLPTLSRAMPEDLSFFQCHHSVLPTHDERGVQVMKKLEQSALWKQHHGSSHVFVMSTPVASNQVHSVLTDELNKDLAVEKRPPIFLTSSASTNGLKQSKSSSSEGKKRAKYAVDVPQMLSAFIHQKQPEAQTKGASFSNKIKPPHERKHVIYMEETFSSTKGSFEVFSTLAEVLRQKGESVFINLRKSKRSFLRVDHSHAQMMADSKFCLLFSDVDNTEGKNRLYDALASGCIPIFVQNEDNPKPKEGASPIRLPFKGQIDWKRIGFYFSSINCLDEHMIDTIRHLQEILETSRSDAGMQELINMQQYGLKAYDKMRLPNTIPDYRLNMRFGNAKIMETDSIVEENMIAQIVNNSSKNRLRTLRSLEEDEFNDSQDTDNDVNLDDSEYEKEENTDNEKDKEKEKDESEKTENNIDEAKENAVDKAEMHQVQESHSAIPDSLYANEYEGGVIQSILTEIEQKPRYHLS